MRRSFFVAEILVVALGLTSCSFEKLNGELDEVVFQGDLSEEEMNQDHIALELADQLLVDADITPYKVYEDGLNSYYIDDYTESEEIIDESQLRKGFTMFGKSPEEIIALLEKRMSVCFSYSPEELVVYDADAYGEINVGLYLDNQVESEVDLLSCVSWWDGFEAYHNPQFICGTYDVNSENWGVELLNYYYWSFDRTPLDFGGIEEVGDSVRTWVEELLGEELCAEYDCAVLSEENFQTFLRTSEDMEELSRESYVFFFYRSVDGFPWRNLIYSISTTDDMILSESVARQILGSEYVTHPEWAQVVEVTKDGVICLSLKFMNRISGIYKEKERVADLNTVLLNLESYYEKQFILSEITITDIKLCYASSFSDAEDGEICNIVKPFWSVRCWDESEGTSYGLQFDGYSGEFMQESSYVR